MAKSNRKPSPDEGQPEQKPSGREDARAKLQRMEDTNKLCYKHRNDMDRLVAELKKFHYSDAELDYILEPKGNKNIQASVKAARRHLLEEPEVAQGTLW